MRENVFFSLILVIISAWCLYILKELDAKIDSVWQDVFIIGDELKYKLDDIKQELDDMRSTLDEVESKMS